MRYLRRQRMHTSSIASIRLEASIKFNLGDGEEPDSDRRMRIGRSVLEIKKVRENPVDGDEEGDGDDEHKDDEDVGLSSKNKGKKRLPDNDDHETLIEMLALVAGEGDETKVAEEHVCTGMTLVTCLSSTKFEYIRKRKKSSRAYRGKISASPV